MGFRQLKKDPEYTVRAVERVVQVLVALSQTDSALPLSAIAARTGLTVWTTLRLLRTLQDHGLVICHPTSRCYTLGFRLLEFGQAVQRQVDVVRIARPFLSAVRNEINETISLVVRSGDFSVNVAQADSSHPLRRVKVIGEPSPLYVGASGKVFLAAGTPEALEAYLARTNLVPLSPNTLTEPRLLREQVEQARALGYAVSINERGAGGVGIAAPVYDHEGQVVAAVDVAGPLSRLTPETRERWVQATVTTARDLSAALGFADRTERAAAGPPPRPCPAAAREPRPAGRRAGARRSGGPA
jgi:DNA-binding IclR family transcriptional regulator